MRKAKDIIYNRPGSLSSKTVGAVNKSDEDEKRPKAAKKKSKFKRKKKSY